MKATLQATPASPDAAQGGADQSLPDPSRQARWCLLGLLVAAGVVGAVMNHFELTADAPTPLGKDTTFVVLASFYAAAQVIERLMELVVPSLPAWPPRDVAGQPPIAATVKVAQVKADRAKLALGVAAVVGVIASAGLGLFLMQLLGLHVSNTVDSILTGLVIAGGTKPLHDFITLIQKPTNPTTGTKVAG